MIVSVIVAIAENGVIGIENRLPWRLPADLKYFKEVTRGHHIIMGRKTYESLGKPLPDRVNIVITRQKDLNLPVPVFSDIKDAIALAKKNEETECFVIGGAEIFRQNMASFDRLYITRIHENFEGDTFFPEIDKTEWKLIKNDAHRADEKNAWDYTFEVYERV